MTFKEFWEEGRRENVEDADSVENWMSNILREEGFSDKEISQMKMKKVGKLMLETDFEMWRQRKKYIFAFSHKS